MIFHSVVQHLIRLVIGDPMAWRYLPYRLEMKLRRVDLGWVSVKDSGLSQERSHWHSNSGGPELNKLLGTLPISCGDAVLDIGCGKGGAMLTLARYPFARVDGVEISPNLARIARENLQRLRILNARVFCADAADFWNLDPYSYFYMYNPFPQSVMQLVMKNMALSLERRKRQIHLIYKNAMYQSLVLDSGFCKISESKQTHPDYPPFAVFVAGSSEMSLAPLNEL